jgi:hypothetical protein
MAQTVYFLTDNLADPCPSVFINKTFESPGSELTEPIIFRMAQLSTTKFFYVLLTDRDFNFSKFDFSYRPEPWSQSLVHVWDNNPAVKLFNKSLVLSDPSAYTDMSFINGKYKFINIECGEFRQKPADIIFLSYDENNAEINFTRLSAKFPRVKHVRGIQGIFNAHLAAAQAATTRMFYLVDADAEVADSFDFSFLPDIHNVQFSHVWHSKNPVNDLEYGYGGIKLFMRDALLTYKEDPIDFTTSVSAGLKVINEISNITRYNINEFSTWKSAFRECAKLASRSINNQSDPETTSRLETWCKAGVDRDYGKFAIAGAIAGRKYGNANATDIVALAFINDFEWLRTQFDQQ